MFDYRTAPAADYAAHMIAWLGLVQAAETLSFRYEQAMHYNKANAAVHRAAWDIVLDSPEWHLDGVTQLQWQDACNRQFDVTTR